MKPNVRTLVTVSLLISYICLAQGPQSKNTEPAKIFTPSTMIWKENAAVLLGDPAKPGPFVVRLKMIDALIIPPHWHPEDENITVIDGVFLMGMGDKVDTSAMKEMSAGSFATMPKGMHHFVSCRGATTVQLHGMGPLVFKWVNPEDDPERKRP
jgi:quercetin dioxygenase-like cupin family protein